MRHRRRAASATARVALRVLRNNRSDRQPGAFRGERGVTLYRGDSAHAIRAGRIGHGRARTGGAITTGYERLLVGADEYAPLRTRRSRPQPGSSALAALAL